MNSLDERLYIAALLARTIDPPTHYVGKQETIESYATWTRKIMTMTDALLAAHYETSPKSDRSPKATYL